jgi:release factor glutamine methyltransferase
MCTRSVRSRDVSPGEARVPRAPLPDVWRFAGREIPRAMRVVTLPGVFRPRPDSWLLARHLCAAVRPGASVLDVCTGSGAIAVAAAGAGAGAVTAIDVSRRAVVTARINARLNGVRVRALRGDLFAPVAGERFDAIACNPPYLPAADTLPTRGPARALDGGIDGRVLLDRVCAGAASHLRPGGCVLLVHSSVCGVEQTVERLRATGLRADVVERRRGPLGPLLTARAPLLEARGLLAPGEREEEIVVVRGTRAAG